MPTVQHKRGTRSALNTIKNNSQLSVGQIYFISDENRLAIATAVNNYVEFPIPSEVSAKVTSNNAITGATKTKITYDAKGLVTAGADIAASDLPSNIDASKIANGTVSNTEFQYLDGVSSSIQTQLNGKSATTHNHNLNDLTEKSYNSLTDKPTLFSGSYAALTNKPDIPPIVVFYTQTNLTISGNNGNFFLIEISADSSFSLSNITTGTHYYFRIKNTGASTITITLPNTADIKASATTTIGAGKYKELAMIYDGTNRTWQISEELT